MSTTDSVSDTPVRQLVNELELLKELVPLQSARVIELGCGNARLARDLLQTYPDSQLVGLEVDRIQHAANLAAPAERLTFVEASAHQIPFADASFDLVRMEQALAEIGRVLRPGGYWYVSEPVYDGALNELVRLFNDEGEVRAAAQALLDRAASSGGWERVQDVYFDVPVSYRDFADFENRMVNVTYAERRFDAAIRDQLQALFAAQQGPDGAQFVRPMHVTLLRRLPEAA